MDVSFLRMGHSIPLGPHVFHVISHTKESFKDDKLVLLMSYLSFSVFMPKNHNTDPLASSNPKFPPIQTETPRDMLKEKNIGEKISSVNVSR